MVEVWHAQHPTFGIGPAPKWPDEFTKVAEVATDSVEEAWGLTNHVDRPWWDNPGVTLLVPKQARSSSVGDVLVVDGRPFRCASVGWEAL
jgi:hypothetical protein